MFGGGARLGERGWGADAHAAEAALCVVRGVDQRPRLGLGDPHGDCASVVADVQSVRTLIRTLENRKGARPLRSRCTLPETAPAPFSETSGLSLQRACFARFRGVITSGGFMEDGRRKRTVFRAKAILGYTQATQNRHELKQCSNITAR